MVATEGGEEKFSTLDEDTLSNELAPNEVRPEGLRRSSSETSQRTVATRPGDRYKTELNRLPGSNRELSDSRTMIDSSVNGVESEQKR